MLTPKKHMNLNISLIRVSALILKESSKHRIIEFETMRRTLVKRYGSDAELTFIPALSFLYTLGKIEYHIKNDTLEYIG